jgi:transglutaminase-like putative cysteine protease
MKFWKFLFASLLCTLYFVLSTNSVHADDAFAVDAVVTYKVENSGKTLVTHDVTLENLFSTLYATTYTLSLENIDAQNVVAKNSDGKTLQVDSQKDGTKLNLKLTFNDYIVGKGAKRHFTISYENGSFATKTGEVWEISIPRLSDQSTFRSYQVNLLVPDSFGQEAYISPQPISSGDFGGFKSYSFSKDKISSTGVTAGFGQFQVFSFNLFYHLENPLAINSQTEIALPPDTAFQKVYFSKIDPKPADVRIDEDGNWLAVYKLTPRQRVDVNIVGSVQIFASYRAFPKPSQAVLNDNLLPTGYWQSDNEQIKLLAVNLKTPEAIYDFVSKNLKYDTARVQPNVQRIGAVAALASPDQAICMEFTDLFIAIARAAGIPAREINGYAYTENKDLQPLSLVNDVLHAWPEYYDKDSGAWIPIDPTWGATSGVDYFNKLDLRHFAFVIHGKSDTQPYPPGSYKLGTNPQKDVYVSFGQLPAERNSTPKFSVTVERNIPFLDILYSVKIYNPGPASLDAFYPTVYFDNVEHSRDFVQILPPYATYQTQIKIPFNFLGKNTPDNIKITVNESQFELSTNKTQVVVNSLLVVFILFIVIVILVMIRLKKINLGKITATIAGIYAKIIRKFGKDTHPTDQGIT